jgi:cysteine-rich repeat protein
MSQRPVQRRSTVSVPPYSRFAAAPAAKMHRGALFLAWLALGLALLPGRAWAHAQAPAIEQWGPFLPGTQTCLRRISAGAHACFDTALEVAQHCRDAQARGEVCDEAATEAAIGAAESALRATLVDACDAGQLTELSYIGVFDAGADLSRACVGQSADAIAAIYAPARQGAVPAATASCMAATAAYGRKVMWFALQREAPVMERIATRLFTPEEKLAAILQVGRELSADRARWSAGLLKACPEFEAVYGRTPDGFLRTLKQRVDCVLSLTYVHSAISCLAQVCGNGIPEPGEACDDGNADDSDGCRADCTAP